MRAEDKRLAAGLPFFQGIDESSVDFLLRNAELQRFPAHVDLIRQDEPPEFLHVVVEGRVEVFSTHRMKETTVDVLPPGACFILAAVFLDQAYLKSARSLTPVRLLLIPAASVRAAFRSDAGFAETCAAELARGYRRLVKEVSNIKLRSSLERLANWLLVQAGTRHQNAAFVIPFDKKTLAAKLGIAPEVLSRNFATLAQHGVTVSGKSVVVADRGRLQSLAVPSRLIDDPDY